MSAFTERLDNSLKEMKKTKKELFAYVGISPQSFYDWKNRNTIPAADIAVKIAQYLNTTVEYLITGQKYKAQNDIQKNMQNDLIALSTENQKLKDKIDKALEVLN